MIIFFLDIKAQDTINKMLSFSFSWTPVYYAPNNGKFRLDAIIPLTFETNVSYNLKNISIVSGLGFQEWHQIYLSLISPGIEPVKAEFEPDKTERMQRLTLRVPIQINYIMTKSNSGVIPYLRMEFANEFAFYKSRYYSDDIYINSESFKDYSISANAGYGILIKLSESLKLVTELSMGTYLLKGLFNSPHIKFKIGVMI